MRRRLLLAVAAVLTLPLTACGSSSASSSPSAAPIETSAATTAPPNSLPTVTGAFGSAPTVTFRPDVRPPRKLTAVALTQGTGPQVATGDATVFQYTAYVWRTGQEIDSSYDPKYGHKPFAFVPGSSSSLMSGLNFGLIGQHVGSRVLLIVPPEDGAAQLDGSVTGVQADDTLVYVADIVQSSKYLPPGQTTAPVGDPKLPQVTGPSDQDPTITIPPNTAPPTQLVARTLITGTGPVLKAGDVIEARYTGVLWRNGQVFDSTAKDGNSAFSATLDPSAIIQGWVTGLTGQHVGSRVLLVVPPSLGYGSQASNSIPANSTLVFVVDILGAA